MAKPRKPKPLTAQQQAFIEHYLMCWNATEAARRADYSEKTARQIGSRLLTNVDIQTAIEARLATMAMSANEVLARLTEHARGSIEDFLDKDGDFSLSAGKANGKLGLIKKLKRTTRYERAGKDEDPTPIVTIEIELHDQQAALVHMGKKHGVFVERTEITGKDGGPVDIGVRAVDYRAGLAALAPIEASDAPELKESG